ncbi:hypothetical protein TIFTF001_001818 [Ficus carica]|uniref:MO25-like protein n=1 Tax=Ficus carica TaxID=3494 RepID=A0AA88CR16_FICCA|nr:hypothetical protein TIFTF001_001818 [Ficus carica]
MKCLLYSKPKSPGEMVRQVHEHLIYFNNKSSKTPQLEHQEKSCGFPIRPLFVLVSFKAVGWLDDRFRLLIICLPKLDLGIRQDATHVIANLQRQRVSSRLIASEYMEKNLDLMNILILGYEDSDMALTYGAIVRECIRHQTVAKYILESEHMKKIFDYIEDPNFEIAADATATFKFFNKYNSKLLGSPSYITRRQSTKLLGDILLDRTNSSVKLRYVSSLDNLKIFMNLLRDSNKTIQLETFRVFKLFVGNQNKPTEIVNVLVTNKSKLLRFFEDFKFEKVPEQFETDKAQVVREIENLERKDRKDHQRKAIDNCQISC